ncbi:hypothetical protein XELAEV_18001319mg [Xenopus laevis]|nr:hypothetical protein XELAEV_18001319mg [Xenopus laevis]
MNLYVNLPFIYNQINCNSLIQLSFEMLYIYIISLYVNMVLFILWLFFGFVASHEERNAFNESLESLEADFHGICLGEDKTQFISCIQRDKYRRKNQFHGRTSWNQSETKFNQLERDEERHQRIAPT